MGVADTFGTWLSVLVLAAFRAEDILDIVSSAYRNSLTQLTLLRIHQGIFRAILDPFGLGGLSRLLLMDVTSHISHIQIELSKKRRKKEKKSFINIHFLS